MIFVERNCRWRSTGSAGYDLRSLCIEQTLLAGKATSRAKDRARPAQSRNARCGARPARPSTHAANGALCDRCGCQGAAARTLTPGSALRRLTNPNSTMAKPADPEQPSFRRHDARRTDTTKPQWKRRGEAMKPLRGRKRIERCVRRRACTRVGIEHRAVLESILQDIDEHIPHLARPGERAPMPTIRPKPAAAKEQAIHASRYAHHEPTHARPERRSACGFDDQVRVIVLDRIVHDPEVRGIAVAQRAEHRS